MNKGEIVKKLLKMRSPNCDFVFCAGDDRTDEDMFKRIRLQECNIIEAHSCTIGPAKKKTFANWHVTSTRNIIDLVIKFAEISGGFLQV
jgi:trehalose-phosphatase